MSLRASLRTRRILCIYASVICLAAVLLRTYSTYAATATQLENAKAGTTAWQLTNPATNREIEGYASLTSVNRGGQISFFVNTAETNYKLRVFRMGWYGGAGGREMMPAVILPGTVQPAPTADPTTGMVECNWASSYVLSIPNNALDPTEWMSGVYLVQLTGGQSGKQSYIVFVVRDDARHSDFLFQSCVTTYQAYNTWGGKSLYAVLSSGGVPARKVSFNRPYAMGPDPSHAPGVGAGEFLTNLSSLTGYAAAKAGWEYNMVRWLEREGYDVTYCTNIDTHASPATLLTHHGFLSVGHDEYWTAAMRANVESARDHGVNLGFFSADACYWQIRLENSPATGAANRTVVGYKDFALTEDPLALDGNPANDGLITTQWRKSPINRPEEALIGVMYATDPVNADIVIANASHWVCAGAGLSNGDHLPGLLGYEVDRTFGNQPANTEIIGHSPFAGGSQYSDMTVYTAASGATVFAAGSMQWNWGLDDYNAPGLRPALSNAAAQQMTRNVLARFLGPIVPLPPPSTSLLDTFNDNARDTAKWNLGTVQGQISSGPVAWDAAIPVLEQNQRLEISPRVNVAGDHYSGYVSAGLCDLTDGNASVEVVQVAAGGSADTEMALCIDPKNSYMMLVEAGTLYFAQTVGGSRTQTSVAYNPALHRFWRIRHTPATDSILFETSSDRQTWTTQRTVARTLALTGLRAELSAGTYQAVAAPGTAIFDEFRLESNNPAPANQLPVANPGGPYSGTAGQAVTFNGGGSSDPDGTLASYAWSYGDGTNGTGTTPAHTYALAGSYTVTLTVTDNSGGTRSASTTATIAQAPPPPAPSPNDDFNDNTRDTSKWGFGTIQGALYNGAGADSAMPVLEQNQRLEISPRANVADEHYNGYLSNAGWNLTNAAASVEVVQVAGGGTADTELALCIDRLNFYMIDVEAGRIYFEQVVGGIRSGPSIVYDPAQHRFWRIRHDPATDAIVFETSPNGQTWTVRRTVVRQMAITALRIELSAGTFEPVAAPGTAIFDNLRIDANGVAPPPTNQSPVARPAGPYSGTTGQAVAFSGSSSSDPDGTIASYQWSFGDGASGSGATPTHAYASAGTYTVTLTVTDNAGATNSASTTANIVATANQTPIANPGGPYSGTTGGAVAFNGSGSSDPDGSIASYQWSYGDNATGSGATPTHAYAAAGTYTVTLTVTDNRGATRSASTTATISTPTSTSPSRYRPPGS